MRLYLGPPWTNSHQIWALEVFDHALLKYGIQNVEMQKNFCDITTSILYNASPTVSTYGLAFQVRCFEVARVVSEKWQQRTWFGPVSHRTHSDNTCILKVLWVKVKLHRSKYMCLCEKCIKYKVQSKWIPWTEQWLLNKINLM